MKTRPERERHLNTHFSADGNMKVYPHTYIRSAGNTVFTK